MPIDAENTEVQIRNFEKDDIVFAVEQTGREGWDATTTSFGILLNHDPDGSFVALVDARPAGMVTTTCYKQSAWIGNLIVPPEFRRRSIGIALMRRALRHLENRGAGTIRLEADPPGVNIYRRLGFCDEYESPRFRINSYNFGGSSRVSALAAKDLAGACELDMRLFGDDRSRLLGMLLHSAVAAFRYPISGRICGYLYIQTSKEGYRLGPWVAENVEIARELLVGALSAVPQKPAIVAIPGVNRSGLDLLSSTGFGLTPSSLRMVLGPPDAFGIPEAVYGLAGGAIG